MKNWENWENWEKLGKTGKNWENWENWEKVGKKCYFTVLPKPRKEGTITIFFSPLHA
jgi:hypothetical protein